MSVLPIADSKTQLNWINQRNKTQKQHAKFIADDKDGIAFIMDFSSPTDKNQRSRTLTSRPDKKSKRLTETSENWIG